MADFDPEEMEREVDSAIRSVLAKYEGAFVFKWIALIETQPEGELRGIWTFTAEDQMAWDSIGMMEYAVELEKAALIAWHMKRESDEDS